MSLELWLAEKLVRDTVTASIRYLCVNGYRGYAHGRFIGTDMDLRREVNRILVDLRNTSRDIEGSHWLGDYSSQPRRELQALRRKVDDLTRTVKSSPHGSSLDVRIKRISRSDRKSLKAIDLEILSSLEEAKGLLNSIRTLQAINSPETITTCTNCLNSTAEGFNTRTALIGPLRWRA